MSRSEFVVETYTNEFGQKIQPGEEVLFAGTSWKRTSIRKGVFKGVRYANVTRIEYVRNPDGSFATTKAIGPRGEYDKYLTNTKTSREVVAVVVEKVNKGKKWQWKVDSEGKKTYVKTDEDVFGTSTLPLKRVYKFSSEMNLLEGTSF
jgi:hypothetical protein